MIVKYKEETKEMSIKKWFEENVPTEFSIPDMNPNTKFKQVYLKPQYVYELIGVPESEVRITIFELLSYLYDVDYDDIYNRCLYDN